MKCWVLIMAVLGLTAGGAAANPADPFAVTATLKPETSGPAQLAITVSVPPGHQLYADELKIEGPAGTTLELQSRPPADNKLDPFSGAIKAVYLHDVTLRYAVNIPDSAVLPVIVRYQGCNESQCFLPVTKTLMVAASGAGPAWASGFRPIPSAVRNRLANFRVMAVRVGYVPAPEFLAFLDAAQAPASGATAVLPGALKRDSWWLTLFLILIGGLALNLTPCVLPMIPINLAIIGAGVHAGSRRRGFALGALYGLGMTTAYGILGLLVVLTGSRFGTLNGSPWFNFGIAALFVVLALAMFDVWIIDFSRFQSRWPGSTAAPRGMAIVLLGALAAVLAGACVAPVLISMLLLATDLYARGQAAGLLLPFLLGLGMALPWPLAGAGLSFLPKPGRWMVRVKQVFGLFILSMATYYAYVGFQLWQAQRTMAFAHPEVGWLASLEEGLNQAEKDQKPLLIDFWATWCKNCHAMDATVFQDQRVRQRLGSFIKVKYRADQPDVSPAREDLDAFGVVGLPTYVILKPLPPGR